MRILYLSLSYLPSRRASSVQVMKMCAALARRGHDVVLVAKRGDTTMTDGEDHAFYCVEPSFTIDKIARPPRRGGGLVYAAGMAATVVKRRRWTDVVYCRDPVGAMIASQLGLPVIFEAHGVPTASWLRSGIARAVSSSRSVGLVAISEVLRRDLCEAKIAPTTRPIVVAHDACDPPSSPIRNRPLGRPPIVGYVGSLYPGRGIELVVRLARELPHLAFRIVGGNDADLARWRATELPRNLELVGFRPQAELPRYYATMDVVVMPYAQSGVLGASGSSDISRWTSPMKMFEYMASGVPIVSSNLPVLREVLRDGENALLVPSGDISAWRRAIERLVDDDQLRHRLAVTAHGDLVRSHTWDARAAAVMMGLGLEASAVS